MHMHEVETQALSHALIGRDLGMGLYIDPGWKGSHVSSAVHEYLQEIRHIRAPNHAELTHNTRPSTHDDSACYVCTYGCDKH